MAGVVVLIFVAVGGVRVFVVVRAGDVGVVGGDATVAGVVVLIFVVIVGGLYCDFDVICFRHFLLQSPLERIILANHLFMF